MSILKFLWCYRGLFLALIILVLTFKRGVLKESFDVYQPPAKGASTKIVFKKLTEELNIDFTHHLAVPEYGVDFIDRSLALGAVMPSINVADFNGDGYLDFLLPQPHFKYPSKLYINKGGTSFSDEASRYNLVHLSNPEHSASVAAVADLNGDGFQDIFLARWGCHSIFWGSKEGLYFTEERTKICNGTNSINIADLNEDGWLDLVLANYAPKAQFKPPEFKGGYGDKLNGEANSILYNKKGKFFVSTPFLYKSYSMAVGLADLNRDHRPDVFFGNDYSPDEMFMSQPSGKYKNVTGRVIPYSEHGSSGMGAEFGDINNDGHLDLYVSNIYKPPFFPAKNILWMGGQVKRAFVNVANSIGVARCGWAWTAKFVDFDNDGNQEIIVANGRYSGPNVKNKSDAKSYWYTRVSERTTPKFFRKAIIDSNKNVDFSSVIYSGLERSCLFQRQAGSDSKFEDVAELAGIAETGSSRALAIIDFDNDGRLDVLFANFGGKAEFYRNQTETNNNWIGFKIEHPIGAKLVLSSTNGHVQSRWMFPLNGFRSQHDPRAHFGLGQSIPEKLTISWPNGQVKVISQLEVNRYNEIKR